MDASTVSTRALRRNFSAALDLVADIALHPSFPAEEIERQRAARLGQLVQQRENAGALAGAIVAAVLYGNRHPYGFTELGTEASVKALTRDAMVAFWKQHFVPGNAALVVAGDISMAELRTLADKAFGGWQRGQAPPSTPGSPAGAAARLIIVDRPGAPQTQLRVAGLGMARSSPDYQTAQVMNAALGGLFSSRINMNLRERHGYTYGAYSQFTARRHAGPFVIGGGVRTDVTAPAVTEIFNEVRGMLDMPLPQPELQKAKDALSRSLPGAFETTAEVVGSYSNVYIYDLGLDYYSRYADQVNAVSADHALTVAKKYLDPGMLRVVAIGDRARIEPELRKLNLGPIEIRDGDGRLTN
jgi:zinc protease